MPQKTKPKATKQKEVDKLPKMCSEYLGVVGVHMTCLPVLHQRKETIKYTYSFFCVAGDKNN